MVFTLRHSKYRHIFADTPKPEHCFTGFRLCTVTGEQQYIKASAKYFALSLVGGGGPVSICRHDRPGRFERGKSPILSGHTGAVLDFEWNPFDDSMLATASEDTTIKIWTIPDDWEPTDANGNSTTGEDITESLVDLVGHKKKVTLIRFNPTVDNVLASTSSDMSVKVWDIQKAEVINSFDDMGDLTHDLVWDFRGDNYAASAKDKLVRFMDGRTGKVTNTISAHDGVKSVKLSYMGESGKFLTVGSSKQASREMKLWDLANTSKPIYSEKIDNASGVLVPLYDNDSQVLYLCGKGDGIIRPYEFEDTATPLHRLNDGYRSTTPTRGVCLVPKRGNDIMNCETARLLKLTNSQGVHPLSFIVPRKSDAFQDDIFPDCPSLAPAHEVEEWLEGSSKVPITMSLNPALQASPSKRHLGIKKTFTVRTVAQVEKELKEANARIKYLEEKLQASSIEY
mmetsp:Transcript_14044/g.17700  ORF Transcript_14044/g.17700 Transcript_14044/m.17700 type:complete len:454 (+) Transcript_14044:232-1593(+)|eukprot:CAMPEP_0172502314 /NCGR_PEP_ID=MMETSP1066-20121228/158789_1 /TAXON_ID=671091 /ORGANISM="Coscinodiscus wailesii, Strain CCMP2513" /LENGTH=453 /DNA_ID=CAMNT_0013277521 /DNA_START=226 /DNA_END=1587 /DNA_ORIENTATION=-